MARYIAFLRAINVAGHARVTMPALAAAFSGAGCTGVRTFIQSGNVIFEWGQDRARLHSRLRQALRPLLGAEPEMAIRSMARLRALARSEPFGAYAAEPGIKLYVVFLSARPRAHRALPAADPKERLEAIAMRPLEVFVLSRRKANGFYGFPNVFIERALGVPATTRNWSTVTKVAELAASRAPKVDRGTGSPEQRARIRN
jgi:uncharacterized protein (DUF1697 family)